MEDISNPTMESSFELNDAKLNAVQRRLARPHLVYILANSLMFLVFSCVFIFDAAEGWIAAYANGTDDFAPVGWSLAAAFMLYFLWINAKAAGAVAAHARRPDTTICKGHVDGVSLGPCTTRLTEDAIEWVNRDYAYALHLAGVHHPKNFGQLLFLSHNIPETQFAFGHDMAKWPAAIVARKKRLNPSGWPLPEGESWRRYKVSREDFESGLSELELSITPPGSLKITIWSLVIMLFIAGLCLIGLTTDPVNWSDLNSAILLPTAACIFYREIRWFGGGYRRKRKGMSPYGRDVLDVTHGDTDFRIDDDGIEIRRALLRKTIRWEAVASVEQKGGWLSLRAADITLDILPSSTEIVKALGKVGFDVPCGPWERSERTKTWRKAA